MARLRVRLVGSKEWERGLATVEYKILTDWQSVIVWLGVSFSGSGIFLLILLTFGNVAPCFAVFRVYSTYLLHVSSRIDREKLSGVVV